MVKASKINNRIINFLQNFSENTSIKLLNYSNQKIHRGEVALGFVFPRSGVGGTRNHLNAIKKYSKKMVSLFPENFEMSAYTKIRPHKRKMMIESMDLKRFPVVHSHVFPSFIAASKKASSHSKWVHTYHTLYFPEDWGGKLLPWQEKNNWSLINVAKEAHSKISVSIWLRDYLKSNFNIDCEWVPNGVDVELCRNTKSSELLPCLNSFEYLVFVGHLADIKNPLIFINAAMNLPKYQFVMVGKNLDRVSIEKKYGIEIPKNLHPVGPQNHEKTLKIIDSSKALVMTSKSEGFPTVLMEAMALGRPVVAPATFGCQEVIGDEENGFTFKPNDFSDMIRKIEIAVKSPEVGVAGYQRVLKNFDWKVIAKKIDEIYEY